MARILVAEDEHDIRELISLTLVFNGFDVADVQDGVQALDLAKSSGFDLIILDVRMPRMSGYEVCRALRAMAPTREVPIIFLSAKGQESEIQEGLQAGASDYILKPFSPEALSRRVKDVLGIPGNL